MNQKANKEANEKWLKNESRIDKLERTRASKAFKERQIEIGQANKYASSVYDPYAKVSKRFKAYNE